MPSRRDTGKGQRGSKTSKQAQDKAQVIPSISLRYLEGDGDGSGGGGGDKEHVERDTRGQSPVGLYAQSIRPLH